MTAADINTLVGSLGVPAAIVIGSGVFLGLSVWPWYTKRQAVIDAQQAKRDEEVTKANERFILALEKIVSRMDSNHAEVMREIHALRPRLHLEPDRDG